MNRLLQIRLNQNAEYPGVSSMTADNKAVFDAALALPETERALLAEALLQTLPSPSDELSDEELFAELERRRANFEQDPTSAIPASELLKEE
jgi:putative addiction module component (TIGR02574 family)